MWCKCPKCGSHVDIANDDIDIYECAICSDCGELFNIRERRNDYD